MPCYKPLKAYRTPTGIVFQELRRHDILGDISVPCGQCIGCRIKRAHDWASRVMHEASLTPGRNTFVTLTYDDAHLPPGASLRHRDFQLFMKRLRNTQKSPIRFYMCGEYGETTERPHYHACLFNYDPNDKIPAGKSKAGEPFFNSPSLSNLWPHGHAVIQQLNQRTAAYCARYITQKLTGDMGAAHYGEREPPYNHMSTKPGLGFRWFQKYQSDVYPHDYLVLSGGKTKTPPKYYDKLRKRSHQESFENETAYQRQKKAQAQAHDNTPERLTVKEAVALARLNHLKRNME